MTTHKIGTSDQWLNCPALISSGGNTLTGTVAGNMLTQYPDLFGAVVVQVPIRCLLSTQLLIGQRQGGYGLSGTGFGGHGGLLAGCGGGARATAGMPKPRGTRPGASAENGCQRAGTCSGVVVSSARFTPTRLANLGEPPASQFPPGQPVRQAARSRPGAARSRRRAASFRASGAA